MDFIDLVVAFVAIVYIIGVILEALFDKELDL